VSAVGSSCENCWWKNPPGEGKGNALWGMNRLKGHGPRAGWGPGLAKVQAIQSSLMLSCSGESFSGKLSDRHVLTKIFCIWEVPHLEKKLSLKRGCREKRVHLWEKQLFLSARLRGAAFEGNLKIIDEHQPLGKRKGEARSLQRTETSNADTFSRKKKGIVHAEEKWRGSGGGAAFRGKAKSWKKAGAYQKKNLFLRGTRSFC